MDFSLIGGQEERKYKPYNWRFLLALLGILLLAVAIVFILTNDNTLRYIVSNWLIVIAYIAIILSSSFHAQDKSLIENINAFVLFLTVFITVILLIMSALLTGIEGDFWNVVDWGRVPMAGLSIITTGLVLYNV